MWTYFYKSVLTGSSDSLHCILIVLRLISKRPTIPEGFVFSEYVWAAKVCDEIIPKLLLWIPFAQHTSIFANASADAPYHQLFVVTTLLYLTSLVIFLEWLLIANGISGKATKNLTCFETSEFVLISPVCHYLELNFYWEQYRILQIWISHGRLRLDFNKFYGREYLFACAGLYIFPKRHVQFWGNFRNSGKFSEGKDRQKLTPSLPEVQT